MGKTPISSISSLVLVTFCSHTYVNRENFVRIGYNGFRYDNNELIPVYP
jgi:hypothetical protein